MELKRSEPEFRLAYTPMMCYGKDQSVTLDNVSDNKTEESE